MKNDGWFLGGCSSNGEGMPLSIDHRV